MFSGFDNQVKNASLIADRLRIVLLEDNPDDMDLIQEYLAEVSSAKFAIIAFETLSETIEYLAHNDADIIISDLGLPDSQGLETLERLRAGIRNLPVIVLTGLHDEQVGMKAVRMGAQDYLVKDEINSTVIYRTIIYAMQRFQMERELRQHRDHLEELVEARTAELRQEIEQRKQVEAALQSSETRFRSVAENSLVGIYLVQGGFFQYVNPAFAKIFAYKSEEIIGKLRPVDLVVPDDRDLVLDNFGRRIDGEFESLQYVFTGRRKDGTGIHCEVLGKRVDYDGQPSIIGTLVDVTDRIRAEEAEREQRALAETLRETITTLASHLDPDQVMQQILENIGRVVSHDVANIMLIRDDEAYVSYCHGYSPDEEERARSQHFSLEIDSFRRMLQTGQPLLIAETATYPHWQSGVEHIRSYLGTPILVQGQVIGFINLNSAQAGYFTLAHVERLKIFAAQAAIAVQNASMYDQIRQNADEMQRLQQATTLLFTSLNSAASLTDLTNRIEEAIVKAFHLVDAGIMLLNENNDHLVRMGRAGSLEVDTKAPLAVNGPGLVAKAARFEQIIYDPDVTRDSDYVAHVADTRSELAVPLSTGANLVGVIDLQSPIVDAFSESDQDTLKAFADRATIAIENMQLHEALRLYATGLEERMVERTAQLERLNQRMSAILNNTSDAIILADADGLIDITNPAFDEQFGYLPDELFGQSLISIADPAHREMLEALRETVLAEGTICRGEIVALRNDGTVFEAEVALSQVRYNESHIVCSLHDISHLKAVERMKDEFISTVSHELRTPITAIVLVTEALNKYYDRMTEEQILKRVDQLRTQSNVLAEMVESILDISRLEMRESAQTRGTSLVNMGDVVRDIVGEVQPSALAKRQNIELTANEAPVFLTGEQMDFARIWRNLITNAVKYTPEGGHIYVRMQHVYPNGAKTLAHSDLADQQQLLSQLEDAQNDYVIGQVEDTGYGIRPEDFDSLFKRFDRGWAKESNIPGTGLGLALVRELLAIYGGDIHVSSQLKRGSIFTFWIPIEEETKR